MDVDAPEFIHDPYRFYRKRRQQAPVIRSSELTWTITGHDAMARVLGRPQAGRGNTGQMPQPDGDVSGLSAMKRSNPALRILDHWLLFKNPPQHTRLRKLISKGFTPATVAGLEPYMRKAVRKLLDQAMDSGGQHGFDLVADLARPFPVAVIGEMIGIPAADRDRFRAWTQDFALAVQVDFRRLTERSRKRMNRSAEALTTCFETLLQDKRRGDDDDLVSRLIAAGEQDDGLSREEILANCVFLLFSGYETTTSLIGNGMNALLENPGQLEALRADPGLLSNTVEECLRYDPPVQMVGRYVLDDIAFDGQRFPAGHHIHAFLGAAGRDPAANPDPDIFDITRGNIRHLAFARGPHHCLGANLARLELRVALEEIVDRFPRLRPSGPSRRRNTWLMRGFESLPVRP